MRRITLGLVCAVSLSLAVPAIAASGQVKWHGNTSEDKNVQFSISKSGTHVVKFRFVSRCPSDSVNGTLVPGRFKIVRGKNGIMKFSHKDSQFKIKGRFTSSTTARGTAQNDTGNCHSGKLKWFATPVPNQG
jgi:hypothetical protein